MCSYNIFWDNYYCKKIKIKMIVFDIIIERQTSVLMHLLYVKLYAFLGFCYREKLTDALRTTV